MATPTKRHMNWSNVIFVPADNPLLAITFTGVTSVQIDSGGSLVKFAGDGDRYNTLIVNDFNDPTVTVHTADLAALSACPTGSLGTFTATHNDARNGAGTGAITYTLINAVVASSPLKGSHRQFGQGTITFTAFSTDGLTNPLTTSIAS